MRYRKRPITVEAVQWEGDNFEAIFDFANDADEIRFSLPECQVTIIKGSHKVSARRGDFLVNDGTHETFMMPCVIFNGEFERVDH